MERISKLCVKGGFYDNQIEIDLRTDITHRVTTIYGSNGSGKSSIANAILEYKHGAALEEKEFIKVSFLADDLSEVVIPDDDRENIWVYSEKYIEKNIEWNDDKLGAIVMFGEQIDIDTKIQEKNIELSERIDELKHIDTNKYEREKGEFSIYSASESIRSVLRKSWSEREKKIRNLKSVQVTENVLNQIYAKEKENSSYNKLKEEYDKKVDELLLISKDLEKLPIFTITTITKEDIEHITKLLEMRLVKPEGTKLEEKLLNLVLEGKRNLISDSLNHFTNIDNNECPYCMQEVSGDHRDLLLKSIISILNEEVEQHSKELRIAKEKLSEANLDLDYLRRYESEKIIKFTKNIDSYNKLIQDVRKSIDNKIDNPFDSIHIKDLLSDLTNELKNQSMELINFINGFNSSVDSYQESRDYLLDLNKRIARLEIDDNFKKWLLLRNELNKERKSLIKITEQVDKLKEEIKDLNTKKSRVDIALKDINNNLQQIFSGKNRISLELDANSNYRVKTRGKKIKLKKLSTGERNVISLCYFFAHLRNNTNAYKKFSNSYFIVLDDPISSLDFDNKIGIYAFLRKTLGGIISENEKSRILILTHDLEVVYKLDKVFDDIKKSLSIKNYYCGMRLLSNKNTKAVNVRKMNNYGWNIEEIYNYACSNAEEENNNDFYVGNVLRKTLEAYATFNFRKDISGLTQSETILNKIENSDIRDHFKNRMLRLLLNSESHTEETASAIIDHDSFEQFSKEERIQISRDVLCLLFLLDKEHIKSYLPDDNTKIENIEKWIENCKPIETISAPNDNVM